jgi:hypothetical protein
VHWEFEDSEGRKFRMAPAKILRGHWSPHENSSGQSKEVMLARTKAKAAKRGGHILTGHYKNSTTKLECQSARMP